jgi:hypothetical protein
MIGGTANGGYLLILENLTDLGITAGFKVY